MLVLVIEPGHALAAWERYAPAAPQAHQADPVLALGSGYAGGNAARLVRALQHRLKRAGYAPGPIDGRYGPTTEQAVEMFQSIRGLRVDGIAGPLTLAALRTPSSVLYPGAGYLGPGSGEVRVLQLRLRRDGYSPGPIDGRYGPLTERAVRRFQARHALRVDGIAGPLTFGELTRIAGRQRPVTRSRPPGRGARPSRRRLHRTRFATPSHSGAPQTSVPGRAASRARASTGRHGGTAWPVALLLAALLALAAVAGGVLLVEPRRRKRTLAALQPAGEVTASGRDDADEVNFENPAAVEDAFARADERGDATAAANLGVLLERRGDLVGAEAAYRRADERGDAGGAFNLGAMLEQRGDLANAAAAYDRAGRRGDAEGSAKLGMLLERQHDYRGALQAYRQAQRSDRPEVAELAQSRADALAFGLSLAEKRGER
jgi:peptidoglycan hydrolase-like protein with peptidoglycan-binding domain